jgi:hypothetical protein
MATPRWPFNLAATMGFLSGIPPCAEGKYFGWHSNIRRWSINFKTPIGNIREAE